MKGIVLEARSGFYKIQTEEGQIVDGIARKKVLGSAKRDSPIIPGDNVSVEIHPDGNASIEKVYDRSTLIQRGSEKRRGKQHAIVANVDYALIVFAADKPKCRVQQIDRYLIAAEYQCLKTCLVFNKWDLKNVESESTLEIYKNAGYDCVAFSALSQQDVVKSEVSKLDFKKLYIMGPSGVGKSSIINALFPDERAATGSVNLNTGKGRHTTTHVELLPWDEGRYVADTPGMGQLVRLGIKAANLKNFYKEFIEPSESCKYRTCLHINEPGCAVKEELGVNLTDVRYQSYLNYYSELVLEEEREQQRTSKKY